MEDRILRDLAKAFCCSDSLEQRLVIETEAIGYIGTKYSTQTMQVMKYEQYEQYKALYTTKK